LTTYNFDATLTPTSAETALSDTNFTSLSEKIWAPNIRREDLVQRVANALREQILSGQLSAGAKLMPEAEFARNLSISRPSLREAIRILAREGLIVVKHGVGTFITNETKPILGSLELMRSMTDMIRASGGEPACRDLSIDLIRRLMSRRNWNLVPAQESAAFPESVSSTTGRSRCRKNISCSTGARKILKP
jgi:DNA-binding transcriptional MocR family regulator